MKFLLDHCVPNRIADVLTEAGHEVVRLRDCLPTDSPDPIVLSKAEALNAALLSLNGDFADITTYPPEQHRGIIALQVRNRPESIAPMMQRLITYLVQNPQQSDLERKLLLVEAHRIRVRT